MSRTARELTKRQWVEFVSVASLLILCGVAAALVAMMTNDSTARLLATVTAGVGIVGGVFGVVRSWMLWRLATRDLVEPIGQILESARMVEAGGLPALAAVRGVAELEAISRRFNAAVAEFELERILADKVRDTIESRAATASHVAHLHQEAVHESETDGLTGLLNRRRLDRDLPRECQRVAASGGEFTYVMIDIDHFKNLNDSLGHQKGDEVLRLLASTLLTAFRGTDGVYRYGGEEFALILRDAHSESVMATLDKVRQRIEERSKEAGVQVTASFGAAQFPRDASTAEALISTADGALFQAKAQGRNQVVIVG